MKRPRDLHQMCTPERLARPPQELRHHTAVAEGTLCRGRAQPGPERAQPSDQRVGQATDGAQVRMPAFGRPEYLTPPFTRREPRSSAPRSFTGLFVTFRALRLVFFFFKVASSCPK